MSDAAKRTATYEDLKALPEDVLGQIVDGELIASPRPSLAHARAASVLGMRLGGPFDLGGGDGNGPGGWWILDEPELHLGPDVLVPDLAGWRRDRLPTPPAGPYTEAVPDWICEVLSPSTARVDRIRKMRVYARAGVAHAWLVEPEARVLEGFRRHESAWLRVAAHGADERVRAEPFEAVELALADLWISTDPGLGS